MVWLRRKDVQKMRWWSGESRRGLSWQLRLERQVTAARRPQSDKAGDEGR